MPGSLGRDDGRIALYRPDRLALLLPGREEPAGTTAAHSDLRLAARGVAIAPRRSGRLVPSRAARRGAGCRPGARPTAAHRTRAAGCTLGSGLGRRGQQRHVRATASPALASPRWGPPPLGRASAARTAHGTTRGGRSLVAGDRYAALDAHAGRGQRGNADRAARGARRHAAGATWSGHAGCRPGGGCRRWLRRCLPRLPGAGGARPRPPGLLRGGTRRRAVRGRRSRRSAPLAPPRAGAAGGPRGVRRVLLAAADPANPYGAALAWPRDERRHGRSPSRAAGAYVVLHDGELVLYLERGGRSLQTFAPFDDDAVAGGRGGGPARRSCPTAHPPSPDRAHRRSCGGHIASIEGALTASASERPIAVWCWLPGDETACRAAELHRRAACLRATPSIGPPTVLRAALVGDDGRGRQHSAGRSPAGACRRQSMAAVTTLGKHLIIGFEVGLTLHTHLGHEGSVASVPAGRALAQRSRPCRCRDRDRACGRRLLRCPGRRAAWIRERSRSTPPCPTWAPTCWLSRPTSQAAVARVRSPTRREHDRRGGPARSDAVAAGLGNVYRSEVLFLERVDPFARSRPAGRGQVERLLRTGAQLLRDQPAGGARVTVPDASGAAPDASLPSDQEAAACGSIGGRSALSSLWHAHPLGRPWASRRAVSTGVRAASLAGSD